MTTNYKTLLADRVAALGNGCFQCGGTRTFGDFCGRDCQREYYQTDGPTRRWAATELAAERDYANHLRQVRA